MVLERAYRVEYLVGGYLPRDAVRCSCCWGLSAGLYIYIYILIFMFIVLGNGGGEGGGGLCKLRICIKSGYK